MYIVCNEQLKAQIDRQ